MTNKHVFRAVVTSVITASLLFVSVARAQQSVNAVALSAAKSAPKPKFGVVLKTYVYNAVTAKWVPSTVFRPGDHGTVTLTLNLPPGANAKKFTVDWSGTLTIAGVKLPITLKQTATFQNKYSASINHGGPLFATGSESRYFKVNEANPASSLRVTATTTIETLGSVQSTVVLQIKR